LVLRAPLSPLRVSGPHRRPEEADRSRREPLSRNRRRRKAGLIPKVSCRMMPTGTPKELFEGIPQCSATMPSFRRVIAHEAFHPKLPCRHAVMPRLRQSLFDGPAIMPHPVARHDGAGAIRAVLAM